jgi:hypothetical protein
VLPVASSPGKPEIPTEYTVFPDLNERALKAKEDKFLRFWYILRTVAPDGYIPLARAVAVLKDLTKYNNSSIYRILEEGDGELWSLGTPNTGVKTVFLRSLAKVGQRYGIPSPPGLQETQRGKVWTELTGHPENVRAWLYKRSVARVRNEKDAYGRPVTKPLSRAKIEERTGVRKHTQLRYEGKAKIRKTHNYAKSKKKGRLPGPEGDKFAELRITPDETTDSSAGGRSWYRQLPNSYPPYDNEGDFEYGPNGPRKRANRELRRGCQSLNADGMCAPAINSFSPRAPYAITKRDWRRLDPHKLPIPLFSPTGFGYNSNKKVGLWEELDTTEAAIVEYIFAS